MKKIIKKIIIIIVYYIPLKKGGTRQLCHPTPLLDFQFFHEDRVTSIINTFIINRLSLKNGNYNKAFGPIIST